MKPEFFGYCDRCGEAVKPVYFTEEEYETTNGIRYLTGRKRRAVSHLECSYCFKKFCVDDSFDGPWR